MAEDFDEELKRNAPDLFAGSEVGQLAPVDVAISMMMGLDAAGQPQVAWYLRRSWNPWLDTIRWALPPPLMRSGSMMPDVFAHELLDFNRRMVSWSRDYQRTALAAAVHTWFLRPLGGFLGGLHGYARSGSAAHAALWAGCGLAFPLLTTAKAAIQGYAKPQ